jgi:hypothetical protein
MNRNFGRTLTSLADPRWIFVLMIIGALFSFELFNYSTTEHALMDIMGGMEFGVIRWSTLLSIAFCSIDFAGIAKLFTPEQGVDEPKEIWYLFVAWLIGATANAILTWWGVMMALTNHPIQSASVISPEILLRVVPIFVAIMVWVVRILIVGTLSTTLDRMLHSGPRMQEPQRSAPLMPRQPLSHGASRQQQIPAVRQVAGRSEQSDDDSNQVQDQSARMIQEPTYHSLSFNSSANRTAEQRGRLKT